MMGTVRGRAGLLPLTGDVQRSATAGAAATTTTTATTGTALDVTLGPIKPKEHPQSSSPLKSPTQGTA